MGSRQRKKSVDHPVTPQTLYHGAAGRMVESIRQEGLVAADGAQVRLFLEYDRALADAAHYDSPVVVLVQSGAMERDGHAFTPLDDGVYLTDIVPARHIVTPPGAAWPLKRSCGFLILRDAPNRSFLLMRHRTRWDLPKGHVDPGETDMQCALRELEEETGIARADIEVDPGFRFEHRYLAAYKRTDGEYVLKTLVVFMARLTREVSIRVDEHPGYEWIAWQPPHRIQPWSIDPVLAAAERHMAGHGAP